MINIFDTVVFGFRPALHGMRNPKESWSKSDSVFYKKQDRSWGACLRLGNTHWVPEEPQIGPLDFELMRKLIVAGNEHRKFMRAIGVWTFIEPNRGCWQEIDTYKIATVRNSCSTMHKLGTRPLTIDDFQDGVIDEPVLKTLNILAAAYRKTKNYKFVIAMKRRLPEGYIQGADYHMNYENAINMFHQRWNHRLPEWRWTGGVNPLPDGRISICDWIYSLPYMAEIIQAEKVAKEAHDDALREEGRQEVRALRCGTLGDKERYNVCKQ